MSPDYDVIVVGGGMVGGVTAHLLGQAGLSVALIERDPAPSLPDPLGAYGLRVSAINPGSERVLRAVGVWERLPRVSPYRAMAVWDREGGGRIGFDSADIAEPYLGHIVENDLVRAGIWDALEAARQVALFPDCELSGMDCSGRPQVALADGRTITAHLVVGADGVGSRIRDWAGIATGGWPYEQEAVVANVATERPHEETAWQRFLPSGPLAFLPLADGDCSIVWSTTPSQAQALCAMDEPAFLDALSEAFEYRLGRVTASSARRSFPLAFRYAQCYVRPGVALVGDAAHRIHPLAGQGVNLGFLDAAALAQVVESAHAAGRDIGGAATLRRYERWRKGENFVMLAALDGLKRLFGAQWTPVRWARGMGLNLTDKASPVKRAIMLRAMGLTGDPPHLVRAASRVAYSGAADARRWSARGRGS